MRISMPTTQGRTDIPFMSLPSLSQREKLRVEKSLMTTMASHLNSTLDFLLLIGR
jgi:hypothetical protein